MVLLALKSDIIDELLLTLVGVEVPSEVSLLSIDLAKELKEEVKEAREMMEFLFSSIASAFDLSEPVYWCSNHHNTNFEQSA